jgi:hypothetical protein
MQNPVHNLFAFLFILLVALSVMLARVLTPTTTVTDEDEIAPVRDDRPMRSCLTCED